MDSRDEVVLDKCLQQCRPGFRRIFELVTEAVDDTLSRIAISRCIGDSLQAQQEGHGRGATGRIEAVTILGQRHW